MTKATYCQPCQVDTYVKSDTHNWSGRSALKCRLTRSSGHGAFASGTVVNARDWTDDGQVDLMMRRGNRTYYQYLKLTNGFLYGAGSRDLGNAPGPVQDIAQR